MATNERIVRMVVRGILRESTSAASIMPAGVTVEDLAKDLARDPFADSIHRTAFKTKRTREETLALAEMFNQPSKFREPVPVQQLEALVDLFMEVQDLMPSFLGQGTYDSAYEDAAMAFRIRPRRDVGYNYDNLILYGPYNPGAMGSVGDLFQWLSYGKLPSNIAYTPTSVGRSIKELQRVTPGNIQMRANFFDTAKDIQRLSKSLSPEQIKALKPQLIPLFHPGDSAGLSAFYQAHDLILDTVGSG